MAATLRASAAVTGSQLIRRNLSLPNEDLTLIALDVRAPAGFLFGKPIDIEPGDHDAVTDADETPADLVLISPKFERPAWRLQPAQHKSAMSSKGFDDQKAQASAMRPPIPALFPYRLPGFTDCCRGVVWAAHDRSARARISTSIVDLWEPHWNRN